MTTIIRDLIETDKPEFLAMCRDFYTSEAVLHAVPEEHFERTFEENIKKSPFTRGLVFLLDGEVAGYALLSFTWSNEVGGMVLLLEELFLREAHRGQGVATAFFRFLDAEYGERIRRVRLEVTAGNDGAIQLYKRQGFVELKYAQMVRDQY